MNKNIVIGGIGALVVIAVTYFFIFNKAEAPSVESEGEDTSAEIQETKVEQGVSTFMSLFTKTETMKCTYSTDAIGGDSIPTNGVIYTAGGRVSVKTTMIQNNEEMTFNTIDDGTNNYSWGQSTEGTFAIKTKHLEPTTEAETVEPENNPASFDYNQEVEYDCTPWTVDDSVFVPPSDIVFMDLEMMMSGEGFNPEALEAMMQAEAQN